MDGDTYTTEKIIGCAVEVHRRLGPGLLESVYESALCIELELESVAFERQVAVPLHYRGTMIAQHRIDLIVAGRVVVEIKSVERLAAVHMAQVLTYLKVTSLPVGLLLNFNGPTMKSGVRRVVLKA